jgi:hypothetical protein
MSNLNGFQVNSYNIHSQSRSNLQGNESLDIRNNKSTTSFYSG